MIDAVLYLFTFYVSECDRKIVNSYLDLDTIFGISRLPALLVRDPIRFYTDIKGS